MKKSTDKTAAILTLREPGKMTPTGRKEIAAWLRRQAKFFLKHGESYSKARFTARYRYRPQST